MSLTRIHQVIVHYFGRLVAMGLMALQAACGGSGSGGMATLQSIELTATPTQAAAGTTAQLTATAMYSDGTHQDVTGRATWSSSNAGVAAIGAAGSVSALTTGSTTISGTLQGMTGAVSFTVTPAVLVSIGVTPPNPTLAQGTTVPLTATGVFSDQSTQDLTPQVTWSSSSTAVATVGNVAGAFGLVNAVSTGSSTITASAANVSGHSSITVSAAVLASIAITPTSPTIALGSVQAFTATGTYSDHSTQNLTNVATWASDNLSAVTISNAVNSTGLASAVAVGTAHITASIGPIASATTVITVVSQTTGGPPLLTPSDFTYLGSYPVQADATMTFGQGLTLRYVSGQLRFLAMGYAGAPTGAATLFEFKLPAGGFGTTITASELINRWTDIWSPYPMPNIGGGDEFSIYWEDQGAGKGRLWTTHATDYPTNVQSTVTQAVAVRNLNDDGSISGLYGEYGFEGVGQRAIYGGVQPIPAAFRKQYNLSQRYLVGWGGYASRLATGLVTSLGFMALAVPDVTAYPTGVTTIPASDIKILADHRSGSTQHDWYASGSPSSFDRGVRFTMPTNYYDGGDLRMNPTTAPVLPPDPAAQWLSPAPDGLGRFVWGDTYLATGNWISGPNKQGFIAILTAQSGKAWYGNSTLNFDRREAELHIFDPNDFGAVLAGRKHSWNVQPVAAKPLTADLAPLGLLYGGSGSVSPGGVAGAAYDAITHILWLWCPAIHGGYGEVLVAYQVND